MTHIEFNKLFLKNIDNFIKDNKFFIDTSFDNFRLGTHFILEKHNNQYIIYFYMENNNDDVFFQGFDAYIIYTELEKIMANILVKSELVGSDYQIIDRASFVVEKFLLDYDLDKIEKKDLDEISKNIICFYTEKALPFFEKWHNLNGLYEYIKDKNEDELWDILGQFAPMKKATILRLCNDPNYQTFMDDYFNKQKAYFEEDPEDIDNIRYYKASKELKEILDKTMPIYNL